jgi:hypothetical protein
VKQDVFNTFRPRIEQLQLEPISLAAWTALLKDVRENAIGPCVHVLKIYEAARSSVRLEDFGKDPVAIHLWVEFANLQRYESLC